MGFLKNLFRGLTARDRLHIIRTINENRFPFTLSGSKAPDRAADAMHAALAGEDDSETASQLEDAEFGGDTPAAIQAEREASIQRERKRRRGA